MRIQRQPGFEAAPGRALSGSRGPAGLRRKSRGFNLIELMVVISIGAILMGIGTASYRYVTNANRVSTEVNSLLGDLMLARSEAIKQSYPVIVCPVTTTGAVGCKTTQTWRDGWLVFVDVDNSSTYSSGDILIRQQSAFPVTTDSFTMSDPTVNFVKYNREGFAVGLPTSSVTVILHTTPTNAQWTRCLQITTVGNLTTQRVLPSNPGCT